MISSALSVFKKQQYLLKYDANAEGDLQKRVFLIVFGP